VFVDAGDMSRGLTFAYRAVPNFERRDAPGAILAEVK
jgi:hypothetical protein